MADVEIGRGKTARRGYGFDDIAVVPSRRTRDPEDVSVAWQIDAYRFEVPLVVAPDGQCRLAGDRHRDRPPRRARSP